MSSAAKKIAMSAQKDGLMRSMADVLEELGVPRHHILAAADRARSTSEPITSILLDYGFLSPEKTALAIANMHGYPYFSREDADAIDGSALAGLGIDMPRFSGYVPVAVEKDIIVVAVSDPARSTQASNELRGRRLRFVVASRQTIERVYRRWYANTGRQIDEAMEQCRRIARERAAADEDHPEAIRNLLGGIVRHACYNGASDLYFHSTGRIGVVKMAVDGASRILRAIPQEIYSRLLNRMIVDANVRMEDLRQGLREAALDFGGPARAGPLADLLERYRFRLELGEAKSGPTAVIRILDLHGETAELDALGFEPGTLSKLRRYVKTGHGLVLITGPTGSGKTTTLYAMLKEIDPETSSIQSIEFPVEYRHGLWMQYEVPVIAEDEGAEMAKRLKGLLRNAPNVILIGEIRDEGVARIALDAAHTGHLVFSTLHTNDAPSAMLRLRRLGVGGEDMASALLGVLAQRLVRKLCTRCREPDIRSDTAKLLNANGGMTVYRARDGGCPACGGTGYRGRRLIHELLHVSPHVRGLIESGATVGEIGRNGLTEDGSMWNMGLRLVAAGETSIDEIMRVTRPED